MSEYQPLEMEPIEDDASVLIRVSEEVEFEATRKNTMLNTYLGRAAFDNIVVHGDSGMLRMFREVGQFDVMEEFIYRNDFLMLLNQIQVPEDVQQNYVSMVMQQAPDTIPEGW